ncbi:MAG: GHKL domain-containing protein [Ruminococcus sp.]|nr:GHKL domain-containing protein [Ruminococcus sp.]
MFGDIIYVISYIFTIYSMYNFMTAFFDEYITPKPVLVLSYILYPVILCTTYLTIDIPLVNLTAGLVAIFILTMNYKSSMKKRIVLDIFITMLFVLIDSIIAVSFGYTGVSPVEQGSYSYPVGYVAIALVVFIASLISKKFKKKNSQENVSAVEWIASITIPISSMYIIIIFLQYISTISKAKTVAGIVVILFINTLVFALYDRLSESNKAKLDSAIFEQEKKFYYEQCQYMQQNEENIRSFRHDMKNHLFTVAENIRTGEYEQAESYIKSMVNDKLYNEKIYSSTGNIAIDSVLNYKLNEAAGKNICINADIKVPSDIVVDPTDITSIVGNLLDNSINAVSELSAENREIIIKLSYDRGRLFIAIQNKFDGAVKISDGRPITKKDTAEHGYGLKNVERTLEKYNGQIEYQHSDGIFKVSAMMYASEKST